jgi:predicted esterase
MHPSGFSGLELIEPLAGIFAHVGFALLTLPEKDFSGWRGADANRLMLHTLPAVARTPGVDARKPVLLGYSAGAQMALELWASRPEDFGGLLLVAGAPRISQADEHAPPSGPGHDRVPLLAFIGERDGSAPLWREALAPWRAAGVPLQVREVPEKGHQWLLSQGELARALEWLDGIARSR